MRTWKKDEEMKPWIGVDLDRTLAVYDSWKGLEHIGEVVEPMKKRVLHWFENGWDIRIVTARVSNRSDEDIAYIEAAIHKWMFENGMPKLPITCVKDYGMVELWDDRAVAVQANTGLQLSPSKVT